jgi:5,10-methylenetetrahydrofolate reductase
LGPLPDWKREADFLFVQVSFSLDDLLRWRDAVAFDGPVYAGVMVLASGPMARKLDGDVAEIDVPASWIDAVEGDRNAGVGLACELALAVRDRGAFAGVHLIPGVRYREVAARLEADFRDELSVRSPSGLF